MAAETAIWDVVEPVDRPLHLVEESWETPDTELDASSAAVVLTPQDRREILKFDLDSTINRRWIGEAQQGCNLAMDRVVANAFPVVHHFARTRKSANTEDERLSAGLSVVPPLVVRFDLQGEKKFSRALADRVIGAIKDEQRSTSDHTRDFFYELRRLAEARGQRSINPEAAKEADVILHAMAGSKRFSLAPYLVGEGNVLHFSDSLERLHDKSGGRSDDHCNSDKHTPRSDADVHGAIEELEALEILAGLIDRLPADEREVLLRTGDLFGIEPISQSQLAKEKGVHYSRISQISTRAKRRLVEMHEADSGVTVPEATETPEITEEAYVEQVNTVEAEPEMSLEHAQVEPEVSDLQEDEPMSLIDMYLGSPDPEIRPLNTSFQNALPFKQRYLLANLGKADGELAIGLKSSTRAVRSLFANVMKKFGFESRTDLVVLAAAEGILKLNKVPSGKTSVLSAEDKETLGFHNKTCEQLKDEQGWSSYVYRNRWKSVYEKMDTNDRIKIMMMAIKDDVIELPPQETYVWPGVKQ